MCSVPHPSAGTMLVSCRAPRNSELYRIGAECQQSQWRLHFELESVGERSRWVVCHVGSGAQKQRPVGPSVLRGERFQDRAERCGPSEAVSADGRAAVPPRRGVPAGTDGPRSPTCGQREASAAGGAQWARGARPHRGPSGGVCSAQHGAPVATECH